MATAVTEVVLGIVPGVSTIDDLPSRTRRFFAALELWLPLGVLVIGIRSTSSDCPGLTSDQVVASAAVRYDGCTHSTDAWSKGGR